MVWTMRTTALGGLFGIAALSPAVTLTGICGFVTDTSGNWNTGWYNTYGPDGGKNAYVVKGNSVTGAFLNSGNGSSTQISVDLSVPGYYRLYAFFDGNEIYAGRDHWGINLFFDGLNNQAGISATTTPQTASESTPPTFEANFGTTLNLAANQNIAGAGSLLYRSGSTQILLKDYSVTKDIYTLDRVDNFSLGASGRNDHVTVIGLQVVPEPATIAILAAGLIPLARRRRGVSSN